MFVKKLLGGVAVTAMTLALAPAAIAQQTTGTIRGTVTDPSGAPLSGATVTVTHEPSGTVARTTTNDSGVFVESGLRPGGPYTVDIVANTFRTQRVEGVSVSLSEPFAMAASLEPIAGDDTIVVTATRDAGRSLSTGASSRYNADDIANTVSIGRDLKDIFRRDPMVTVDPSNQDAFSFAGANTRLNRITVDGISQSDDFGLNNNGYPTQRSPISLDAIEALEAKTAPYAVTYDGFFGGSVNVVTKSGGNEFSGSAFYDYRDQDLRGNRVQLGDSEPVNVGKPPFEETAYGVSLGGPIIQDRLFFYVNYEEFEAIRPVGELVVGLTGTQLVPGITSQMIDRLRADSRALYAGYDPGPVPSSVELADQKTLVKLDWNITDDHRATFSYQKTEGNSFNGGGTVAGNTTSGTTAVGLLSRQYDKGEVLTQYRAEIYSDWTDNFSTELRLASQNRETTQIPFGGLTAGQINVDFDGLDVAGDGVGGAGEPATPANAQGRFGPDTFRHDNFLEIDNRNGEFRAEYTFGSHTFLAGVAAEELDFFNVFVPNALGTYNFNTYTDFLNRSLSTYSLTGGLTSAQVAAGVAVPATFATARNGAADFSQIQYNAYIQDTWEVNDNLTLLYGLRYVNYSTDDLPLNNVNFRSRQGFSNQGTLDGLDAFLPRVGFNLDVDDMFSLEGGVGKFTGGTLNVWISNQYSNNGVNQVNAVCPTGPYTIADFNDVPAGCTLTPGNGNVNVLDPNFEIPTTWKANLRASVALDDDMNIFGEVLVSQVEDAVTWKDLRAVATGRAFDGRPIYSRSTTGTIGANTFDMMLTNTGKGESRIFVLGLDKEWENGLSLGLSYTNTDSKDANPATSSVATSNYRNVAASDHNNLTLATSDYEIEHSFKMDLTWRKQLFGENETVVSLYGERRSGLPFSYTFNSSQSSINGTQVDNVFGHVLANNAAQNQLFYVPLATDIGSRVMLSGYAAGEFDQLITRLGLDPFRGTIAPRNAFRGRDVTQFDFRVSQEIPAFFPNQAKLKFIMDVDNIGNLINEEWGLVEQRGFPRFVPVATVSRNASGSQYTYTRIANVNPVNLNANLSLWTIKFGIRYDF